MSIYNITSDQYVLLDLIGTVFAAATIAANLTAILSTMHVRLASVGTFQTSGPSAEGGG
jgi:hypothetical protein